MGISAAVRSVRPVAILLAALFDFAANGAMAGAGDAASAQNDPSFEILTGIDWLNLPSWNSGGTDMFGEGGAGRVTDDGLSLGFSLDIPIGDIGSQPLVLQWDGSVADLSSSSSTTTSLAGQSSLGMNFGTALNGSINALSASPTGTLPATATANVTVNDSAGATATINSTASSPAGGRITQFASSSTLTGGAFTALVTNGQAQTAAAYAAYGDNTGFTLKALGDLSNSAIVSTRSEDAIVVDQTLLLGVPIDLRDGWSVTPKFGPTYRSINRDVDFTRTIDIGGSIAGVQVPAVGFTQSDELDARYIGALGGLTLTKRVQTDLSIWVDARLGGAHVHSRYQSQYSAILPGMAIAAFDAAEQTRNDISLLAGLNAGVRYVAKENVVVGLNAGVDFTSRVPTVNYSTDAGGTSATVGMSHALSYGASVSVTWHF